MSASLIPSLPLPQLISGGQTGADQGALSWALSRKIPHSGWCPKGRKSENGKIPDCYLLNETSSADYKQRTEWNVRDSDATIIFTQDHVLEGGSKLTATFAQKHRKPWLHSYPAANEVEKLRTFLATHNPRKLNVAGQRGSKAPELADRVKSVLETVFFGMPPQPGSQSL